VRGLVGGERPALGVEKREEEEGSILRHAFRVGNSAYWNARGPRVAKKLAWPIAAIVGGYWVCDRYVRERVGRAASI